MNRKYSRSWELSCSIQMCCPPAHNLLLNICRENSGVVVVDMAKEGGNTRWTCAMNRKKRGIASFCFQDNLLAAVLNIYLCTSSRLEFKIRLLQPLISFFTLFLWICFSSIEIAPTMCPKIPLRGVINHPTYWFFVKITSVREASSLKPFMKYLSLF